MKVWILFETLVYVFYSNFNLSLARLRFCSSDCGFYLVYESIYSFYLETELKYHIRSMDPSENYSKLSYEHVFLFNSFKLMLFWPIVDVYAISRGNHVCIRFDVVFNLISSSNHQLISENTRYTSFSRFFCFTEYVLCSLSQPLC